MCHIKLTTRNLTTYTNAKLMKNIKIYGNPFRKQSFYYNCKDIFCRRYRKKIDFTKYIPNKIQSSNIDNISKLKVVLNNIGLFA
jgi:hypothetical protein